MTEHGIAATFYASDGERYHPAIECTCGWGNGFSAVSWEEAGAAFDEHLNPPITNPDVQQSISEGEGG